MGMRNEEEIRNVMEVEYLAAVDGQAAKDRACALRLRADAIEADKTELPNDQRLRAQVVEHLRLMAVCEA